jgi:hypothetical protein
MLQNQIQPMLFFEIHRTNNYSVKRGIQSKATDTTKDYQVPTFLTSEGAFVHTDPYNCETIRMRQTAKYFCGSSEDLGTNSSPVIHTTPALMIYITVSTSSLEQQPA